MNKRRHPRRDVAMDTFREAVINHAYSENMDTSVIEGVRHASDLWLQARRHQSADDIMREVKVRKSDPDIARMTLDLQHAPEQITETRVSPCEHAPEPQIDWVMV